MNLQIQRTDWGVTGLGEEKVKGVKRYNYTISKSWDEHTAATPDFYDPVLRISKLLRESL